MDFRWFFERHVLLFLFRDRGSLLNDGLEIWGWGVGHSLSLLN